MKLSVFNNRANFRCTPLTFFAFDLLILLSLLITCLVGNHSECIRSVKSNLLFNCLRLHHKKIIALNCLASN